MKKNSVIPALEPESHNEKQTFIRFRVAPPASAGMTGVFNEH